MSQGRIDLCCQFPETDEVTEQKINMNNLLRQGKRRWTSGRLLMFTCKLCVPVPFPYMPFLYFLGKIHQWSSSHQKIAQMTWAWEQKWGGKRNMSGGIYNSLNQKLSPSPPISFLLLWYYKGRMQGTSVIRRISQPILGVGLRKTDNDILIK